MVYPAVMLAFGLGNKRGKKLTLEKDGLRDSVLY